jgi:hypothetical protein
MTDPNAPDHGIRHGASSPAGHDHGIQHGPQGLARSAMFAEEEYEQMERSDLGAGRVVVSLMAAIFTVGLLLYSAILIIVVS